MVMFSCAVCPLCPIFMHAGRELLPVACVGSAANGAATGFRLRRGFRAYGCKPKRQTIFITGIHAALQGKGITGMPLTLSARFPRPHADHAPAAKLFSVSIRFSGLELSPRLQTYLLLRPGSRRQPGRNHTWDGFRPYGLYATTNTELLVLCD
jgi:hypothetical protein